MRSLLAFHRQRCTPGALRAASGIPSIAARAAFRFYPLLPARSRGSWLCPSSTGCDDEACWRTRRELLQAASAERVRSEAPSSCAHRACFRKCPPVLKTARPRASQLCDEQSQAAAPAPGGARITLRSQVAAWVVPHDLAQGVVGVHAETTQPLCGGAPAAPPPWPWSWWSRRSRRSAPRRWARRRRPARGRPSSPSSGARGARRRGARLAPPCHGRKTAIVLVLSPKICANGICL